MAWVVFAAICLLVAAVLAVVGKMMGESGWYVGTGALVIMALSLWVGGSIRIVPAGNVGIKDVFGEVTDEELSPGLRFVKPWIKIINMSKQTWEFSTKAEVPSSEGLTVTVDCSLLGRIEPEKASDIYKTIGVNYGDVIIQPQLRSVLRGVTAKYQAKSLYTAGREEIAGKIMEDLSGMLSARGIILEQVLLRDLKLPDKVKEAIENKLKREQEFEQMEFVVKKEEKEAERVIIQARGIAKSQEIINKTLTPSYLQYLAINAQKEMANSQNHTTVYIPSGANGIPLVKEIK